MTEWRLLSWDPAGRKENSENVATAEDVASRASDLLERCKATGNEYPGLELEGSNRVSGSLSIAVAPFGWALIHTSEDYLTQHCTKTTGSDIGPSIPIEWKQETLIPRDRFIPQQLALKGVGHFLDHGTLAPDLPWSDDCA